MPVKLPFLGTARPERGGELAVVLTGGGARGAYQVGLLRWLARNFPGLRIPIVTGVSAGAVNAAYIAGHMHEFSTAAARLADRWVQLTPEHVFATDVRSLAGNVASWGFRLLSGGRHTHAGTRGLVDTAPLFDFLTDVLGDGGGGIAGVAENLRRGELQAVAISTTSYTTGESVVWVQGREIELWTRPQRRAVQTELRVEHVMASTA
ncbi:MAG: patatin-like phospholipase family protein, partial [Gemmatimonadota bacterium]